ncbi:MAG TPA: ABC transporter permease [Solirubrobacteraceae bacterium]|jgi:phospholipid/cholesterol/gamma-HCH transport system permease protein|nr:ABC transporter permease [Solirubrobacteraceae bacterium]
MNGIAARAGGQSGAARRAPSRVFDATVGRGYGTAREFVREIGAMVILTRKTIVAAVRPPFSYGPELVSQSLFAIRLCWFPMVLASLAFTYGPAGIQAASFLNLFGALDRLGGLFALTVIREFAPLVCAIVMAGVAGTAICADLGARKIREELDALQVLGVDPVKSLVVPRFLAIMTLTGLFDIYALLFGTFGGVLVTLSNGAPLGPFFATYFNNATTPELAASLIKTTIFGAMIAIVCCYKGMTVSGGPEGVGRAVNQAVVIAFLGIGAIDYVFTQTLLATHPELTLAR